MLYVQYERIRFCVYLVYIENPGLYIFVTYDRINLSLIIFLALRCQDIHPVKLVCIVIFNQNVGDNILSSEYR